MPLPLPEKTGVETCARDAMPEGAKHASVPQYHKNSGTLVVVSGGSGSITSVDKEQEQEQEQEQEHDAEADHDRDRDAHHHHCA